MVRHYIEMIRPLVALVVATIAFAQTPDAGRKQFESHCASCHGGDGNGGELGPGIVERAANRSDSELTALIRGGIPAAGMPAFKVSDEEMPVLIAFLRSLRVRDRTVEHIKLGSLDAEVLNRGIDDLQVRTPDGRVHLLRTAGDKYREVTSQKDWPGYHGSPTGNRFTTIDQVNKANVQKLAPKWIFNLPNTSPSENTPVVVGGLMYVSSGNECYALDAGTGRQVWHYFRPRTKNLNGNAGGGFNRGVAIAGDRLFMVMDHAHVIGLNRFTGAVLWDTVMADWKQNYNATSAPLIVGDLVVAGIAGGDEGVRGFLSAYDQATGKEAWRFWTAPKRGEPLSETWQGTGIDHPSASTWFTGSYDARFGDAVLAGGESGAGLQRGPTDGGQSVLGFDAGAGCEDGEIEVVFSVHSARRVGLGCGAAGGADRRAVGRVSRANCCCMPIETDFFMCWIAPMENCCWRNRL